MQVLYEVHYEDISGWKYQFIKLTVKQAAEIAMRLEKDARTVNVRVIVEEYV